MGSLYIQCECLPTKVPVVYWLRLLRLPNLDVAILTYSLTVIIYTVWCILHFCFGKMKCKLLCVHVWTNVLCLYVEPCKQYTLACFTACHKITHVFCTGTCMFTLFTVVWIWTCFATVYPVVSHLTFWKEKNPISTKIQILKGGVIWIKHFLICKNSIGFFFHNNFNKNKVEKGSHLTSQLGAKKTWSSRKKNEVLRLFPTFLGIESGNTYSCDPIFHLVSDYIQKRHKYFKNSRTMMA